MGDRSANADWSMPSVPDGLRFGAVMLGFIIGARQAGSSPSVADVAITVAYAVGFLLAAAVAWGLGSYLLHRLRADGYSLVTTTYRGLVASGLLGRGVCRSSSLVTRPKTVPDHR